MNEEYEKRKEALLKQIAARYGIEKLEDHEAFGVEILHDCKTKGSYQFNGRDFKKWFGKNADVKAGIMAQKFGMSLLKIQKGKNITYTFTLNKRKPS